MTYWDYKFLDWLLRQVLKIYNPKQLVYIWTNIQTKKIDLWFKLPQIRNGFRYQLW